MKRDLPETAAFGEFAKLAGFKASYVTQLKRDGRLVLTDDKRAVKVRESLDRLEATRDPSKAGVAARHAATRAAAQATPQPIPAALDAGAPADDGFDDDYMGPVRDSDFARRRARALAVKEEFLAKQAEREHDLAISKLRIGADVEAAAAAATTQFRTRMESLVDLLAPQLVVISDEALMRGALAEAIEHALSELERRFSAMAKGADQ